MTGEEYEFFSNGTDTYGDIKKSVLHRLSHLNPKPRLRDLVLSDSNYKVVKDTTRIPSSNALLYLLITREWTENQQEIIRQVSSENPTTFYDIKSCDIEAFTWGLTNNLTIKSLTVNNMKDALMPAIDITIRQSQLLRDLRLSSSSSINITALADAFRTNNTIEDFELFSNSSNYGINAGMEEFSNMIAEHTTLRRLRIVARLSTEHVEYLSHALGQNTSLQEVDLPICNIRMRGGIALANSLRTNMSIQSLNLSNNKIDDGGARAFADALKINTTILTLNLSDYNDITDVGAKALLEALQINTTILVLDLSHNRINIKMQRLLKTEPRIRFNYNPII
jgi:hypothetical protein